MPIPELHSRFLDDVLPLIHREPRVVGVAAGGSIANGSPDEFSDVDLVLAVEEDDFDGVMSERLALIASWAPVVAAFTGEHVGEPRLVISLIGPELLHVDFKFVRLSDVGARVDELRVLWERDGRLSSALAAHPPAPAKLDLQWIEERFWVWIHYGATKLARGELFEAIDFIAYLRETVFGPLIQHRLGHRPQGARRLEMIDPDAAAELEATLCRHDRREVGRALTACAELYRRWTADLGTEFEHRRDAERLAMQFLSTVLDGPSPSP